MIFSTTLVLLTFSFASGFCQCSSSGAVTQNDCDSVFKPCCNYYSDTLYTCNCKAFCDSSGGGPSGPSGPSWPSPSGPSGPSGPSWPSPSGPSWPSPSGPSWPSPSGPSWPSPSGPSWPSPSGPSWPSPSGPSWPSGPSGPSSPSWLDDDWNSQEDDWFFADDDDSWRGADDDDSWRGGGGSEGLVVCHGAGNSWIKACDVNADSCRECCEGRGIQDCSRVHNPAFTSFENEVFSTCCKFADSCDVYCDYAYICEESWTGDWVVAFSNSRC